MKSLYDTETLNEILTRIDCLRVDSPRQWGKMNAAQMLAHCAVPLKLAVGDIHQPRSFIGRLLGGWVKKKLADDKPFSHNMPTDKNFIVADERDLEKEKEIVKELLQKFSQQAGKASQVHPFFGKMNAQEWDRLQYKHLDHHLRQFAV